MAKNNNYKTKTNIETKKSINKKLACLYGALVLVVITLIVIMTISLTDGKMVSFDKYPVVTIEMENGGIIKAELYPDVAPNTVNNFIYLANSGYYDGIIFHRCEPGFVIQGGDPEGTGAGGPGYTIYGEFTSNGFENNLKHTRGVLSMARKNMLFDSAGSQFFIMLEDAEYLDGEYASFGKVIEGMDVVDTIVNQETDYDSKPLVDQVMKKVTVETFGVEYPKPETINN